MDFVLRWVFEGGIMAVGLLSAIISQDAVGTPTSQALMSEFTSCCSVTAAPEDPPFCNIPAKQAVEMS